MTAQRFCELLLLEQTNTVVRKERWRRYALISETTTMNADVTSREVMYSISKFPLYDFGAVLLNLKVRRTSYCIKVHNSYLPLAFMPSNIGRKHCGTSCECLAGESHKCIVTIKRPKVLQQSSRTAGGISSLSPLRGHSDQAVTISVYSDTYPIGQTYWAWVTDVP